MLMEWLKTWRACLLAWRVAAHLGQQLGGRAVMLEVDCHRLPSIGEHCLPFWNGLHLVIPALDVNIGMGLADDL